MMDRLFSQVVSNGKFSTRRVECQSGSVEGPGPWRRGRREI